MTAEERMQMEAVRRNRSDQELEAAFLAMQMRLLSAFQQQVMNVAFDAVKAKARLNAQRIDAEYQRQRCEFERSASRLRSCQ